MIVLDNAIKYSAPGEHVYASQYRLNDRAEIKITDSGQGISEAGLLQIFDRLFRGKSGERNNENGAGLGLSIAKKLISLHKGAITAISKPGYGTQVRIELPLHRFREAS